MQPLTQLVDVPGRLWILPLEPLLQLLPMSRQIRSDLRVLTPQRLRHPFPLLLQLQQHRILRPLQQPGKLCQMLLQML